MAISNEVLKLKMGDYLHNDRAVCRGSAKNVLQKLAHRILRIIHAIGSMFVDRPKAMRETFEKLYNNELDKLLSKLETVTVFDGSYFKDVVKLRQIKSRLKIAKIVVHLQAKDKTFKSNEYEMFHNRFKAVLQNARAHVETVYPDAMNITRRHIEATSFQLKFQAASKSGMLPLKWSEVPKGAILLEDKAATRLGLKLKGIPLRKAGCLGFLKDKLVKLGTGQKHTHAVLCVGDSQILHQSKGGTDRCAQGGGVSYTYGNDKEGKPRIAYNHAIVMPNTMYNVDELTATFTKHKNQLITRMSSMIRSCLMRIVPPLDRRIKMEDAFKPPVYTYPCSGMIGSLLTTQGLDVGEEYGKSANDVSPGDFYTSYHFHMIYEA